MTNHPGRTLVRCVSLLWLAAMLLPASLVRAQSPPPVFFTNLSNGGTTLNMRFELWTNRTADFAVFVQTGPGTFTNLVDEPRTYLGYATNRADAFACATLLPGGNIWATVVLHNGIAWHFRTGNNSNPTVRGKAWNGARWPTTALLGAGGAGPNVYAVTTGWDVRSRYVNNYVGGNVLTALRRVEHSVMSANLIYLRDAGILHRLRTVVIRADQASDPYEGVSDSLATVRAQWNSVLPGQIGRTRPQIWALGAHTSGEGVAWGGTVTTESACSVVGHIGNDWDIVWRHEGGHNWSLGHYDGGTPEGATINSGNLLARMSGPEQRKVVSFRNGKLGQFTNLGPFPLEVPPCAALNLATVSVEEAALIDVLNNDHDANGQVLTIDSFDTSTAFGATISRSVGSGPGGRDQLLYTPNPASGFGLDRFTYIARDSFGLTALGNVYVRVNPPENDLAGHWPLDETSGTVARDTSGNLRNGTAQTGNAWTNGILAGAMSFNGTNTQVALPGINLYTNRLTITTWLRREGAQTGFAGLVFNRAGNTVAGLHFGTANELRYTWDNLSGSYSWNSGLVVPDNQWVFAALTVEPSRAILYLDDGSGLRAATNNLSHPNEDFSGTTYLGQDSQGGRFFRGRMDDVRIFRHALSAAEIALLAAGSGTASDPQPATAAGPLGGSAVTLRWKNPRFAQSQRLFFGTNFFEVLNATTNSPAFVAGFTGSQFTLTPPGAGIYYWRVDELFDGQPLAGPVWFFSYNPATAAPVSEWRLNELSGTVAVDHVGGRNGTMFNSPALGQPGVLVQPTNRAVTFNGTNQKIDVPYDPLFSSLPLTIEVWCKVTGGQGTYRSPLTCRDDGPARGWIFYAANDNTWQFWCGNGTTAGWNKLTGPAVVANQWVHLVAVLSTNEDGFDQSFFVNGQQADVASLTYVPNTVRPLRIGAGMTESAGGLWFPGSVDQVTIYNTALDATEVKALYNSQLNQAPTFPQKPVTKKVATPGVAYNSSLAGDATDGNSDDSLTFTKLSGPAWLDVAPDGTLAGTPTAGDTGLNVFSVQVTDLGGLSDTATVLVPVGATLWNGEGTANGWSQAANWSGVAPTNGQALVFQGLLRRFNTNDLLHTAGAVSLDGVGFFIGGTALNLAGGLQSFGDNTWAIPSTLVAAQTFSAEIAPLTVAGSLNLNGQALTVTGAADLLVTGAVSGTGTVTQNNSAALRLTGANTFTGSVQVNSGLLDITTATTGSAAYTLAGGAALSVTRNTAGASLPMTAASFGSGNSTLNLDLGGFGHSAAPVVQVGGNVTLNGTVTVNLVNAPVTLGTNVLLKYSGTRNGSGNFVAGTLPVVGPGLAANLVDDPVGREVRLQIETTINPLQWAAGDGVWDTGTPNWQPLGGGSPLAYTEGSPVTFNDAASGASPITVTLAAARSPYSITASNQTKDYILTGSGVVGSAALLKQGAGVLTLANSNSFTGGTTISGGILQLGNGGTVGSVSGNITNHGQLALHRSDNFTLGNVVSGMGSLVKKGANIVTLNANNTFSGGVTVEQGTLRPANVNTPLGASGNSITIQPGARLDFNGSQMGSSTARGYRYFVGGSGPDGNGAMINSSTNNVFAYANISNLVLTTDTVVGGNGGRWDIGNASYSEGFLDGQGFSLGTTGSLLLKLRLPILTNLARITVGNNQFTYENFSHTNAWTAMLTNVVLSGKTLLARGDLTLNFPLELDGATLANEAGVGTPTWTGPVVLKSPSTISSAAGDQVLTGPISGPGDLIVNGGNFTVTLRGTNTHTGGTRINQGRLRIGDGIVNGILSGNVTNNATLEFAVGGSSAPTFGGVISGTGTLVKSGVGTVTLTGTNTYTGTTTISQGRLQVNGSLAAASAVTVNASGTLMGTGTIGGPVTVNSGGTLSPGASIGTLTISGALTLNAGSTNTFEVDGSGPANDRVALGSTVSYGGTLNIVASGTFTAGQTFTLFSGAGATNASNFASLVGSPGDGLAFTFTNGVLSVVSIGPSGPAVLTNSVSGNTLSLSWPAGQGWRLEWQTNLAATPWMPAADSSVSSTNITIDPAKPTVFYRLVYP